MSSVCLVARDGVCTTEALYQDWLHGLRNVHVHKTAAAHVHRFSVLAILRRWRVQQEALVKRLRDQWLLLFDSRHRLLTNFFCLSSYFTLVSALGFFLLGSLVVQPTVSRVSVKGEIERRWAGLSSTVLSLY